ncbi:lipoprotein [Neobacillus bataviensis LMG 21833]|uniref:Lipoprotein n=1 Tax=Neobacillus bataviensis LMG 21833 TaxID=1117379 RepID=K6C5Q8_9BACI|nr:hypothetical protein [Neobacillus bataviensis]EKN66465.1 lipoprotein [Neobacillus bataviensis LMG 21833]
MKTKLFTLFIVTLLLITGCGKDAAKEESDQGSKGKGPKIEKVEINKEDSKNFSVKATTEGKELTYAYYVYLDNKLLKKFPYKENVDLNYKISEPGVYKVRVFVKDKKGNINAETTEPVRM